MIYDYWKEKKVIESKREEEEQEDEETNIELNTSLFGLSFNRVRQSYDFLAKYFVHFHFHLFPFVYCNINLVDACDLNLVLSGLLFWFCLIHFVQHANHQTDIKTETEKRIKTIKETRIKNRHTIINSPTLWETL